MYRAQGVLTMMLIEHFQGTLQRFKRVIEKVTKQAKKYYLLRLLAH